MLSGAGAALFFLAATIPGRGPSAQIRPSSFTASRSSASSAVEASMRAAGELVDLEALDDRPVAVRRW